MFSLLFFFLLAQHLQSLNVRVVTGLPPPTNAGASPRARSNADKQAWSNFPPRAIKMFCKHRLGSWPQRTWRNFTPATTCLRTDEVGLRNSRRTESFSCLFFFFFLSSPSFWQKQTKTFSSSAVYMGARRNVSKVNDSELLHLHGMRNIPEIMPRYPWGNENSKAITLGS